MLLKVIQTSICFEISCDKKCNNCDHLGLEIKVLPIFRLYQKNIPTICLMLYQLNLYVSLVCGKIVMVEIFLLNVSGESKCMTKWQFLLIFLKE